MATKKSTIIIVLMFYYLGLSANEASKLCMKCIKSNSGDFHHLPQMSSSTLEISEYKQDVFGLKPVQYSKITSHSIKQKRPKNSNILHQEEIISHQKEHYNLDKKFSNGALRVPRAAQKPDSFANLRKKMKGDKAKNENQKMDFRQKLRELNLTKVRHTEPHIGGINLEEPGTKKKDNLRKLYEFSNAERRGPYIHPGAECNFEKDCRWSWKTSDIHNGFVIASSHNLLENETGPIMDADNNHNGKLFYACIVIFYMFYNRVILSYKSDQ